MINITGIDLVKFVKKVYELSNPQGLGFLHYNPQPLTDEEAEKYIFKKDNSCIVMMDYVKGRSCKMNVFKNGDIFEISDKWYDHTDNQLKELLNEFNIKLPIFKKHHISCNCFNCRNKIGI